jgi:hypothetical protein
MFWYELMRESHEDFAAKLAETWQSTGVVHTLKELHDKLTSVAGSLITWDSRMFGHV